MSPTPEHMPGFLFWQATASWQRQAETTLEPHALTYLEFLYLVALQWFQDDVAPMLRLDEHTSEEPSRGQLAALLRVDLTTIESLENRLGARDLIAQRIGERDPRLVRVQLRPKGRGLLAAALPDFDAAEHTWLEAIPADERNAFGAALALLASHP